MFVQKNNNFSDALGSIGTNRHFVTGVTDISATQTNLICESWMDIKKSV